MERFAGMTRQRIAEITTKGFNTPNAPNEVPDSAEVDRSTVRNMDEVSDLLGEIEDSLAKGKPVQLERK